jgi:phosphotriesterase-related protein
MKLMTVTGEADSAGAGMMLPHEHVMVDFVGADKTGPHRWNADEVFETMLPRLKAAKDAGVTCIAECTPMFLGRDVRLLAKLSRASGVRLLTNTGLYKAPFLPPYATTEDADGLAKRWIAEWREGIEGSGIRPGFIKIAVNPGPLEPIQRKIVTAAARASNATGLAIACHTGAGVAALECLEVLRTERTPLDRFIYVHADSEPDRKHHLDVAGAGAWVEYDSIGWRPIEEHVELVTAFLAEGPADRLLLSHDAGWYHVGEPKGGDIKPFTPVFADLLPRLKPAGVGQPVLDRLVSVNPRRALALRTTA